MKFAYCNPLRVFFGADELKRTGAAAKKLDCRPSYGVSPNPEAGGGSAMGAAKIAAADVHPGRPCTPCLLPAPR